MSKANDDNYETWPWPGLKNWRLRKWKILQSHVLAPPRRNRNTPIGTPRRAISPRPARLCVKKEQIPACNDDTVQKLQDLHPTRSSDLNLDNLSSLASRQRFWDGEEGLTIKRKWFSVSKVRKYFRTRPALGAADIDGWRGREHVRYLLQNNDSELHELIIDDLVFPCAMGEFLSQFLPELAGGLLQVLCFSQKGWWHSTSFLRMHLASMRS